MNPAQLIRRLRPAAELVGVDPGGVDDAATHDDALGLLDAIADAVAADRPRPVGWEPGESLQLARIRELNAAGKNDREIADALGLTPKAVNSARRRHGVPGVAYRPPATSHPIVRELHARGLTIPGIIEAVQAEHGLTWTRRTVEQYLYECGLAAHPVRRKGADDAR